MNEYSISEKLNFCIKARSRATFEQILERLRQGRGIECFGAYCTGALGLPLDMLTDRDIDLANDSVIRIADYLHDKEVAAKDTYKGRGEVDFIAIRLVRLLYLKNPERLKKEASEAVKRFFLYDDFKSIHPSENHLLMFKASRYLAACHYKNEYFVQYGMSSEDIKKLDRDYIADYLKFRAKRGWAEFNSMWYELHNFNTLTALYDHAEDENIRKLSGMIMDTMLLTMLENTTENGIYGGAHGRAYDHVVTGLDRGIYELNKLYFGLGDFENEGICPKLTAEPYAALSSWRPHDCVYEVYKSKKTLYPFAAYERTHNHTLDFYPLEFGFINKYTYNTKYYSIGCINRQDDFPEHNLSWYEEHQQTNFSLVFAANPKAGITVHHPGTDGLHSYWHGDKGCHCSHLFGHENIVMGIHYLPYISKNSLDFIHANVPKQYYDELIEDSENNRLFVRLGNAYAALMFSHPYEWGGKNIESEIIIKDGNKDTDIKIAFACHAGDIESDGSFEDFIKNVKANNFSFDYERLTIEYANMRYEYTPSEDEPLLKTGEEKQYLNGKRISSDYKNTYDSPFMKSVFDSGIIEVHFGNKIRIMDFENIKNTVKTKET